MHTRRGKSDMHKHDQILAKSAESLFFGGVFFFDQIVHIQHNQPHAHMVPIRRSKAQWTLIASTTQISSVATHMSSITKSDTITTKPFLSVRRCQKQHQIQANCPNTPMSPSHPPNPQKQCHGSKIWPSNHTSCLWQHNSNTETIHLGFCATSEPT